MTKSLPNTDTHTERAVTDDEYWVEGDKEALPSKDDDGKFNAIVV